MTQYNILITFSSKGVFGQIFDVIPCFSIGARNDVLFTLMDHLFLCSLLVFKSLVGVFSANLSKDAALSEGASNGPATPNSGDATNASVSAAENHSNSSTAMPDLETELREFLESEPTLSNPALHDEQSMEIEDILSGP